MKTTKKDYELFKKECKKWIDRFDLNKYKLAFEWKNLDDADARIIANESAMTATIALNKVIGLGEKEDNSVLDYGMAKTEYIKKNALHECIHLLLWRLTWYAESRYIEQKYLIEAEEGIVRKLEKIIK